MNRDDKTVKIVDKRDETQSIMSKGDADDEAMKEKLNAVFRLRLLYNSGEELWRHIGKSGGGNNSFGRVGGKDAFLRRAGRRYLLPCGFVVDVAWRLAFVF